MSIGWLNELKKHTAINSEEAVYNIEKDIKTLINLVDERLKSSTPQELKTEEVLEIENTESTNTQISVNEVETNAESEN